MSAFATERRIRFSDCDPAGIVFYPQYFVMFNGLVEDWFDGPLELGFHRLITDRRIGLPTVRVEAEFKAISRFGERVLLGLDVERLGERSLTLALTCTAAQTRELRMQLRQVIVCTSLDTHSSISIPPDVRAAIVRFASPTLTRMSS